MYIANIGRSFLKIYNKNMHTDYSAKELFEKIVFEKFFNHEKYFKWVVNSPFVQSIGKENKKLYPDFSSQQKFKLERLYEKIHDEEIEIDTSYAPGFFTSDITADTSGQVTNMDFKITEDDIFCAWIGIGFGIEVEGKQVWYINKEKILWQLFKGWDEYRRILELESIQLKPNEIDAWNGVWLYHLYDEKKFSDKIHIDDYLSKNKSKKYNYSLESRSWSSMIFTLAKIFPDERLIINSSRYIYDKQKFVSLGFLRLDLPEVSKLEDLFKSLYAKNESISNRKLNELYQTEYTFQRVSELGHIGLRALEPKDLKKYMPGYSKTPKIKNNEKTQINISLYTIWIIAMLNNKQLLELAERTSKSLHLFIEQEKRVSTKRSNAINNLLDTRNRKDFINALNEIVELDKDNSEIAEIAKELVDHVMLNIPPDNLHLFVTLLKFKYLTFNI